jgi:hypothetical protein
MARSMEELEIEMEDAVGIGSVRKVKNLVSLTGRFRESEQEKKQMQQKAEQFVKQKEEERKERLKKRREFIKKRQQEEVEFKKKQEENEKKQREQHVKEVHERWEKTQQKLEQHQKERESNSKSIKINKEYMHNKLEKQYEQNFVIPALEQKKLQLENLRNFYKPIDREELDDHEKNFLIQLKHKEDEKRFKREQLMKSFQPYDPNKFHRNKIFKEIMEKEKEDKELQEEEARKIRDKAAKMDNYAKLVKQVHQPRISIKKRKELEDLKKSMEMRNRPLRRSVSKQKVSTTDFENSKNLAKHRQTRSQIKVDWKKFKNPMIPVDKPKKKGYVVDYLAAKRNKRWERENEDPEYEKQHRNPYFDWKALIDKELNGRDYQDMLKEKARILESNAIMKQKYAKIKDDVDEEEKASNMLIDALEAKLSILDRV